MIMISFVRLSQLTPGKNKNKKLPEEFSKCSIKIEKISLLLKYTYLHFDKSRVLHSKLETAISNNNNIDKDFRLFLINLCK